MTWLTGYTYRKKITITGQAGAGTNYQIKLQIGNASGGNFNLNNHSQNFPNDIRFTSSDGSTSLDYWIENITVGPITVWIKVPDSLESNVDIYCYYGKASDITTSNGTNTFNFFDDFSGPSIDINKWSRTPIYDHGGADWTPTNGDAYDLDATANIAIAGIHYNIGTFTVPSGATIYVKGYNGTQYGWVEINATNAIINGTIDASSKGYPTATGPGAGSNLTGGGYGGLGGLNYVGTGPRGATYGNNVLPYDIGSGGANSGFNSGYGGGLVKLNISGTLTISSTGSILANGGFGYGSYAAGADGGGSGGTVYISADTFAGSGIIRADGGSSMLSGIYGNHSSGGGGGGRIAIYYTTKTFSGTITANGTVGGINAGTGDNGTIYQSTGINSGIYLSSIVSGELKITNTGTSNLGRLQSRTNFSSGTILETKSRHVSLPTYGYMVAGFFGSASSGLGYLNNTPTDSYRNDSNWVTMATTAPSSTNLLTKISAKPTTQVDISVTNYNTATSYQNVSNIAKNISAMPIALGLRYDEAFGGLSYEAYWDWVRLRKYASPEPTFSTTGTEEVLSPANITATSMTITPSTNPCIAGSCNVTVDVIWTNTGGTSGSFIPSIKIDTIPVTVSPPLISVEVVPSGTKTQQFIISGLTAGTHNICPDPN